MNYEDGSKFVIEIGYAKTKISTYLCDRYVIYTHEYTTDSCNPKELSDRKTGTNQSIATCHAIRFLYDAYKHPRCGSS